MQEPTAHEEEIYREIGQRIQRERKARNMTQTDLALSVGYSRPTSISEIEAGRTNIPVHMLLAIAERLGTSIGVLIGSPDTTPHKELLHQISTINLAPVRNIRPWFPTSVNEITFRVATGEEVVYISFPKEEG